MENLSPEEATRYERQLIMPEIGPEGQRRLKAACVLVSGLGGLGSISASYLVAAGIGRVRLVDLDSVQRSNLNRQLLHWSDDIGKTKVDSALHKLHRLNPGCRLDGRHEEINRRNAGDLMVDCTVVVDGTDNLKTRKVLNKASIEKGIPFVFGGVEGFNGMVTTFVPGQTPCLDCLFPQQGFQKKRPGIIGPLPGLVASIQAAETIKLVLGMKGLLKGRLLHIRGGDMTFKEINIDKNPDCPTCKKKP